MPQISIVFSVRKIGHLLLLTSALCLPISGTEHRRNVDNKKWTDGLIYTSQNPYGATKEANDSELEVETASPKNDGQPPIASTANTPLAEHPLIRKFHARWWNYEKRGYLYLNHGQPQKALDDFNQAIRLRPGDSWRARTYGLHFEEYFPNRGKGMALLAIKEYDKARGSLQQSIDDAPSEKAHYFLKKVDLDQRLDSKEDQLPPVIEVTMKSAPGRYRASFSLQGKVLDDGLLKSVTVGGNAQELPPLCTEHMIAMPLKGLSDGYQTINITATDASGKSSRLEVPVLIDASGPSLILESVEKIGSKLKVKAKASDPSGLGLIRLASQKVDMTGKKSGKFELSADLSEFKDLASLVSFDQVGNQSRTVLPIFLGEGQ